MGNKQQKVKQTTNSEIYFKNYSKGNQVGVDNNPKQKIQLNISLKNAQPETEYTITISISEDQKNNKKIFQEKNILNKDNKDIPFNTLLILDYYFEKQQYLLINIKKDSTVYTLNTTVGNIMGTRGQTLLKPIYENSFEQLSISANGITNSNINVFLTLKAVSSNNNHKLYYYIKRKLNNNEEYANLYKSEVLLDNKKSNFTQIKIPSNILCNNIFNSPILIELFDYSKGKLLGYKVTSVDLLGNKDKNFEIQDKEGSKIQVSVLCEMKGEYTFIDYLRGGLQLGLIIGIDFTGSNGHPKDSTSLHYIGNNNDFNSYEKAIRTCGDILAYYDYDQTFPVFGFGAKIDPYASKESHCFPLSLTNEANIISIDNVLAMYRSNMTKLIFSGPTYFSPLLVETVRRIRADQSNQFYHVLLILTDGMINDMNETIDVLVEASYLPLSIIIVGIGYGDFGNMTLLDADENPLIDGKGRKAIRDLVQFVPFYKFENDGVRLAEQVLEEIPHQVVEYYQMKNIPPGDPIVNFQQ